MGFHVEGVLLESGKLLSYILILFFLPSLAISQQVSVHGKVEGLDSIPLPGVTVLVVDSDRGTATDLNGEFQINTNIGEVLKFSFVGMETKEVEIKEKSFLKVTLREDDTALDEVVVMFKKPVVEVERGKTTFNVDQLATNSGLTAMEMLKKIPGVAVDPSNQIIWRGTSGIDVMIDGKRSYLSGNQLVLFLEGINAQDIVKVELISNPSAVYEAEGNAGLINIVTKKNDAKAYALSLRSSVSKGEFWMNNQNISGSLNKGKWNAYASFDYNTPHRFREGQSGNTIVENGEPIRLERNNTDAFHVKYYTWKAGGEWKITPRQQIGVHYHGYFDDFSGRKTSFITKTTQAGDLSSSVNYKLLEPYYYDAFNVDYQFDIDTTGKRIRADARYISYRNFSDGLIEGKHYDADGEWLYTNTIKIHQPGFIKIKSAQVDADSPFSNIEIQAGLKYAGADNDNNFQTEEMIDGEFVENPEITNHYKYKEQISAAYFSGSKSLGKLELQAGLRLEHTSARSYLMNGSFDNKWDYTSLFPNLAMTYLQSESHKLDMAISRRINRPAYTSLNPIRWYSDEYFYFYGNPSLVPEIGWLFSTSYTLMNEFIFSAEYSLRNNYISQQLSYDENGVTVRSQSANFSHFDRLDFTFNAPYYPTEFWDIQFFGGVNYTTYPISEIGDEQQLKKWAGMLSVQQQLRFLTHYSMDITTQYTSVELRGVYLTKDLFFTDVGVKRSFLDKKLEATIAVTDVFNSYRLVGTSQSTITDYYYNDKPDSRRFSLTLRYLIGGQLIKDKATKSDEENRL